MDRFKNLRNDVQEINTTVQILGVAWAVVAAVMNYKIKEIQSDIETCVRHMLKLHFSSLFIFSRRLNGQVNGLPPYRTPDDSK